MGFLEIRRIVWNLRISCDFLGLLGVFVFPEIPRIPGIPASSEDCQDSGGFPRMSASSEDSLVFLGFSRLGSGELRNDRGFLLFDVAERGLEYACKMYVV